jgi:VCBS repeat-containing protein
MSTARRFIAAASLFCLASTAIAASTTSRYQVVLDTDNNAATGCYVDAASARFIGAEQVVTTTVVTTDTSASVTGVVRQVCVTPLTNGFGAPITLDSIGWPVSFNAASGNMLVETHIPLSAIPDRTIPMRLGFVLSAGNISTSIFQKPNGSPILFPERVGKRHAVSPGDTPRVIHFDGNGNDWTGLTPLVVPGGASNGSTVVRFTDVLAYENSEQFYFLFHALVNTNAPVANDDTYSAVQGHLLNVGSPGVLANDVDPLGGPLTASKASDPSHGSVTLNANGGFTYLNDGSLAAQDAFHYKADNGSADSNEATVTINVVPNSPPNANPDAYTVAHGGTIAIPAPGVLINDTDPEGDTLSSILVAPPLHGTVTLSPNGGFTYTHNGSNTLSDVFTYLANDGNADSVPTAVMITVGPDAPPVANPDSYTVAEGGTLTVPSVGNPSLFANDSDPDTPQTLWTKTIVTPPAHAASFTQQPNGGFTYVHDGSETTSDSFTYTLSDGILTSAPTTVTITVTPVNDAPSVSVPAAQTLLEDATKVFSTANTNAITMADADGGAANEQLTLGVANGTLTLGSTAGITVTAGTNASATLTIQGTLAALNVAMNGLTYAPVANYNGADQLTVTANDLGNAGAGGAKTASATVALTITSVNDVPSFTKGADVTLLEDAGAQTVPNWATTISAGPANEASQTFTFNVSNNNNALFSVQPAVAANGTLTFTPAANANGSATVTINLQDNGGTANGGVDTSANQTFTISVTAVNDAPGFTKGADQTVLEDSLAQTVPGWATTISAGPADEAGQTLSFNASNDNNALFSAQPSLAPDGTLTYTPAADAFGAATVTVTLSDNGGTANGGVDTSAAQTFTINVTGVNDAPVNSVPGAQTTVEDTPLTFSTAGGNGISFGDVDAGASSERVTLTVTNGTVGLATSAGVTVTAGADGSATVTIDGRMGSLNAALDGLVVTPAQDFNGTATLTILSNDLGNTGTGGALTDSDSVNIVVTAVNDPAVVTPNSTVTYTEGGAHVAISPSLVIVDPDNTTMAGALISISGNADGPGNDILEFDTTGTSITGNFVPNAGNLTLSGADTKANYEQVMRSIKFYSISENPLTAVRYVDYSVNDGSGLGPTHTNFVNVTDVNDAPVNLVPGAQATNEDTPLVLTGATKIQVSDVDAYVHSSGSGGPDLPLEVTLSVTNGTLTLGGTANLTFTSGTGSGDATMTFTGVIPDINTALGTVTYTPSPDYSGPAQITIVTNDQGNTGTGGPLSDTDTVDITVVAVNDAPSFTKGADETVLEDSGLHTVNGWATALSAGPADESGQALNFILSNNNVTLFTPGGQPAVDASGNLTYTLAGNAFGSAQVTIAIHDNGGTANGGADTSANQVFTINVTPVNDVPSFTKGADQSVLEDAAPVTVNGWATSISAGPNEGSQTINFVVSNDNNALFSVQPAVSSTGVLTYTLTPNANDSALVTIAIHDDGGTTNGGVDTSANQTFAISVTAVNDAPSFTKGPDQTTLEDAGLQSASGWATALSAGPADEAGQALNFLVSNNNITLFAPGGQPAVDASGNLTYTAAPNAFGSAQVTIAIHDNGGTANGGADTSANQVFNINITNVNDAPSVTKGADQAVLEDAAAVTVNGWATGISAGPNEGSQTVSFNVSNDNNALFSVQPAVSPAGVLTYTLAPNANGGTIVTISVTDNGGTANGGVDTSANQTFNINVTAVNDAPSFTFAAPTVFVLKDSGSNILPNWVQNRSAGPADEAGQTLTPTMTNNNNALFTVQPSVDMTNGWVSFTPAAGVTGIATVSLFVTDNGGTANGGVNTSATLTFQLTIEGAPEVTSTVPVSGGTIARATPVVVNFSEPVNATAGSFTVTCNSTVQSFTISASPASSFTLTPAVSQGSLWTTGTCSANVLAAQITDVDTNDPPNNMAADFPFSFIANSPPVAINHTITDAGNVTAVLPAPGLLTGASDPDSDPLSIVAGTFATSDGGSATFNADGSFSYTPFPGHKNLTDTVSFTVSDGAGGTDTKTLTINLQNNRYWFVQDTGAAPGGGNGTQSSPFTSFPQGIAAATFGETIAVSNGPGAAGLDNPSGSTLPNSVSVIGEGISTAFTATLNHTTLPATVVTIVNNTGTAPTLKRTTGTTLTLGTNNIVRGMKVMASNGKGIAGNTFGTFTTTESLIDTIGDSALDLTNGAFGAGSGFTLVSAQGIFTTGVNLDTITSAGTVNFGTGLLANSNGHLFNVNAGTVSVTYSGSLGQGAGASTVNVTGGHTGTLTFSPSGGNNIFASNTTGTGLVFNNANGTYNFTGPVTLNSINGVNISNGSTGTFSFSSGTAIGNTSGTAFVVNGSTPDVSYGGTITKSAASLLIDITNQASSVRNIVFNGALTGTGTSTGFNFNNVDGTVMFNGNTSLSGAGGISVNTGSAGSITFPSGTHSISVSGTGFNVDTSSLALTYPGSITSTAGRAVLVNAYTGAANNLTFSGNLTSGTGGTPTGLGIAVTNSTSGTVNFSGASKSLFTSTNPGVTLTTNTGSTINFSNGLAITTTTGTAFNANGGGTIAVTGTADLTTGAAATGVNINGITVGASGINFNNVTTTGATTAMSLVNLTGGTVAVNGGTITNGTTGITMQGANTKLSLAGLTITGPTTAITNTTNFNTLTIGASVSVSGATALNLTTGAISGTFANVSSTGGTNGVNLTAITGTWGVTAGTLTGAGGTTFNVSGGSETVSWAGNITQTNASRAVAITGLTGGTLTFSGSVTKTTNPATAIDLNGNSAGTVTFTGVQNYNTGFSAGIFLAGNSGTFISNFTFAGGSVETTTSGNTIHINGNSGGTFNFTSASPSATAAGQAIAITGNTGGSASFTNGSATGAGGGNVISFTGNTAGNVLFSNVATSTSSGAGNGLNVSAAGSILYDGSISTTAGTGSAVFGSAFTGNLTLSSATITSSSGSGVNISGSSAGRLSGIGSTITSAAPALVLSGIGLSNGASMTSVTSTAGVNGISLTNVTGGTYTIAGGSLSGNTGSAFLMTGGSPTISYAGSISGGTRTVDISGANGGTTTLSGAIGSTPVFLNNNPGATINLTGALTLSAATLGAFTATGGGTVNVTATDGTVSYANMISGGSAYTGAPAIAFSGGSGSGAAATAVMGVATITVTNGGSGYTSVPLVTLTGGAGTGATATAVISGGQVTAINVAAAGSGYTSLPAVVFSGGGGSGAAGGATLKVVGVSVTAHGSGYTSTPVIGFSGGGGSGANATPILGGASTLTTTTGIALTVTSTNIGAGNLIFRSVTAGTGAGGPISGIILNTTGSSGGLIVTGTGSAGSGGTIQKTGGNAISLTSVGGSASLTDMNVSNTSGDGITAAAVNNFSCSLCSITNPGGSANKSGIRLTDLTGAASLNNVSVTGSVTDGVNLTNSGATLASLTVSGGSYGSTNNVFNTAGSGLIVIAKTTGVITAANVSGVTFNANFSSAIQSFAQDTATIGDITVSGCTFTNNGAAAGDFAAGTGTGQMKFHFLNNLNITGNKGPVVNAFSSSTATGGLLQGRIEGNQIGTTGVTDSGTTADSGIRVFLQGAEGHITIVNNIIRATACSRGISVMAIGPAPANGANRVSDIVITGNDVDNFSSDCPFPLADIYLTADDQKGTTTTLRAEVHGNKIKAVSATPANTDFPFDSAEWLYFDRTDSSTAAPPQPNSASQLVDFNGPHANANAAIGATQSSGTAKANAAVTLIAGPITTVP